MEDIKKFDATYSGDNVPKLTKFIYPWSGIFRDACYALVASFLMQYTLTSGVLSSDPELYLRQYSVLTTLMTFCLIWDGLNDPLMAFIVEKTHLKLGKFRPWIMIGGVGNALAVILMFSVRPTGWAYVGTCIAFYLLWDFFFTMNDVGYWSMLPSLTSSTKERASLTTKTTVATSIGTFIMNVCAVLLPTAFQNKGVGAARVYMILGIVTALLFLLSQTLVFLLCREKKRDPKQEQISKSTHILDLFRVFGRNKQLRVVVISLFLYYLFAMLLTGIGQNYFYIVFGYGSKSGGLVYTALTVFYIIGTLIAQVFYPLIAKHVPKKRIISIACLVCAIMYMVFLFCCFPLFGENPVAFNTPSDNFSWIFGGSMWIFYVSATIFFGAQGIIYLCLVVMLQDTIDYNEWKFGERKEAVIFAWRPLTVKLGTAAQRLVFLASYSLSGVADIVSGISTNESLANAGWYNKNPNGGVYNGVQHAGNLADDVAQVLAGADKHRDLTILGFVIIGSIMVCLLAMWLLIHFGYKIDEKTEAEMQAALEREHKIDEAAETLVEDDDDTEDIMPSEENKPNQKM